MKWVIANNKDGLWCLVNRPPTMDLGSLQMLRVVDVIPNARENHMKVPLTSLIAWNGDFDGDTLSLYSIKELGVCEAFKNAFSPRHLIVDKVSGYKFTMMLLVYLKIFVCSCLDLFHKKVITLEIQNLKKKLKNGGSKK